jgi:VCBS repeat-containing protein
MRLRYKRPGDTDWKLFINSTTCSVNENTAMRTIVHKDNEGDHDEFKEEGFNGTISCTFFHENNSTYIDLKQARKAKETLTIQVHDGVVGNDLEEFTVKIQSINKTSTVRESVSGQAQFVINGSSIISTVPAP